MRPTKNQPRQSKAGLRRRTLSITSLYRTGRAQAAVEQQAQRDDAEPEHRAPDVPRKLVVEHSR